MSDYIIDQYSRNVYIFDDKKIKQNICWDLVYQAKIIMKIKVGFIENK